MKKLLLSALLVAGAASYATAEEVVVFQDDFEWLAPWSKDKAGDTVACDNSKKDNKAPRLTDVVVDEKTAYDALVEKGYEFSFRYNPNLPEDKPDGYTIYLQRNYLKFNKTKNQNGLGYQAALTLPAFENLPEDGKLNVSFDWCPMKKGDGIFDATQMAVFVINDVDTVEFKAPEHKWETGEAMSWTSAAVTIEGVKEGSKVMIRNTNEGWAVKTAQRWFIDNIKVAYDKASSGVNNIAVEDNANAPVEYFNLQGVRVANPENGLYIRRQGNKAIKVFIR